MFHFFCLLFFSPLGTYKFHNGCDCYLFKNVVSIVPSDFCWFFSFIQRTHPNQRLKALSRMWVKGSISQSLWWVCINNFYDLHWNADSWLTSKWLNQNLQWPKNLHFTNFSQVIIESARSLVGEAGLRNQNLLTSNTLSINPLFLKAGSIMVAF